MWNKIKNFFIKIKPSRRGIIQLYAALLHNANMKGFITGEIFKGNTKTVCAPGLNCYSCPGAVGACPLGSLQNALSNSKTKLPTYVVGIILLYCIILGRTICGFLCPFGLIQDLLYKIKTPKLNKNKITRILSYLKYVILFVLVCAVPIIYGMQNLALPGFCKYICPAGTLGGAMALLANPNNDVFYEMIGSLFTWKFVILVLILVGSVFIYRIFCRFLCPLGALYGFFNKLSILGIKVDKSKCNSCGACINHCKMDVKEVGDHECIMCGECKNVCHAGAINWKTIGKLIEKEREEELEEIQESADSTVQSAPKKINKRKVFYLVSSISAFILLLSVSLYANLYNDKKLYNINDVVENITVSNILDEEINLVDGDNITIIYFCDEINDADITLLNSYTNAEAFNDAETKLNVFVVLSNNAWATNKENINSYADYNIVFAYDNDKLSGLLSFTQNKEYPYSVVLDSADKIIIKESNVISNELFSGIILPVALGLTVGNKVGNICINQEINLIGSDEKFSVLGNRGRITVINFWYTDCTPCVAELPHFNSLYEEYKDYIDVIAIHEASLYLDDVDGVKSFVSKKFAGYSIMFGYDDINSNYYEALGGNGAFPMTVIVDQYGVITFTTPKSITEDMLISEIEKLL